MVNNVNIKSTLLLFLFFIYENSFYGCNLINSTLQGHSRYVISLILLLYCVISVKYIQYIPKGIKQCFWAIVLIPIISMVNCFYIQNQPFELSIMTWLGHNAHFLFLFVLFFYKIKINEIVVAIRMFAIIYSILSIVQVINPSFQILFATFNEDGSLFMRNGIVRIVMPGSSFVLFAYIESLYRFFENRKKIYLFLIVFFLVSIYLRQTRQLFLAIFIVSTIMTIHSFKETRNKTYIFTFVIILIIAVLMNFDSLFGAFISQTKDEFNDSDYNRWVAYDYFFNEIFSNIFVFFFGMGKAALNSSFAKKIEELWVYDGISRNDVGIVGEWYTFGLFYVLSYLRLCYSIVIKHRRYIYPLVRYFVICSFCHCMFIFPLDDAVLWSCIIYISIKSINTNDSSFNRHNKSLYQSGVLGIK